MIAEERFSFILQELQKSGIVRTADLKKKFNISGETVRQDLKSLENDGLLVRVHGGAKAADYIISPGSPVPGGYVPFDQRKSQNLLVKQKIAVRAALMVKENQSVGLDSGTTSLEIAKILKEKFEHLTIVTNSIAIAMELVSKKAFTVICTGGILTPDEHSFISEFSTLILEHLNLDTLFLTTCGISIEHGITDQRLDEVLVHNKMISRSRNVIVVADSSKFGKVSLIHVCQLNKVDTIVTDNALPQDVLDEFRKSVREIVVEGDGDI